MADNKDIETTVENSENTENKDLQEVKDTETNIKESLDSLNDIAKAAQNVAQSTTDTTNIVFNEGDSPTLDYILDVNLKVSVEVGRARMSIQDLLQLGQGAVVELSKIAGEPLDIYMNGKQVAKGEAVIVNEKFGVRVTDIISREERMLGFK